MRWLVLIFFCLTIPAQAKDGPLQTCLNIARQQDSHELKLQLNCPQLYAELRSKGLLAAFEPPLQDGVRLEQLEFLAESRQSLRTTPRHLQENGLDQILANILIVEPKNPESEMWQAMLKWLDSMKSGDYEKEYQWLVHLMKAITPSEQAVQFFFYCSIALLVIISLWLVISELIRAGFFTKLLGKQPALVQSKSIEAKSFQSAARPIRELSPQRQIAALLDRVVNALRERQLIPNDPTLTHRQILHVVGHQSGELKSAFAQLVNEAEPILYGNRPVDSETLSHYWRNAQALVGSAVL